MTEKPVEAKTVECKDEILTYFTYRGMLDLLRDRLEHIAEALDSLENWIYQYEGASPRERLELLRRYTALFLAYKELAEVYYALGGDRKLYEIWEKEQTGMARNKREAVT